MKLRVKKVGLLPRMLALLAIASIAVVAGATASSARPTITVDDSGDPLSNGQALIAAIDEARGMNPSAADPIEIKLASGVFDLASATIVLPDGVDIVGEGAPVTTICDCASPGGVGPWFKSSGSNEMADIELSDGPELILESSGGEVIFRNVVAPPWSLSASNATPRLADASGGLISVIGSQLGDLPRPNGATDATVRGIRATADAGIVIEDSQLRGGGPNLVQIADGRLDIVRSNLVTDGTYFSSTAVFADGAADISVRDSIVSVSGSEFNRTVTIQLDAGGTLDVVGSTLACGRNSGWCGPRVLAAKDAAVVIADSEVDFDGVSGVPIELSGGSLHLLNTDLITKWDEFESLRSASINLLDGASGSMSSGRLIVDGVNYEPQAVVETASGVFVFDRVSMVDATFLDDPNVVCILSTNVDAADVLQSPPAGCGDGAAQSPYGGAAQSVPGVIEAEDYDVGAPAGVSFADSDAGNHRGDYRSDDVDIWSTPGEAGYTVGRTRGGEWLEYTIDVATPGAYEVGVRLATGFSDPGTVRVSVDGSPVGTIAYVPSNGWWNFSTESAGVVDLDAGQHVLRLDITGNGQINLDRIEVDSGSGDVCPARAAEGEAGSISGVMETSASALVSVAGTPNKYVFDGADYAEFCVIAPRTGGYEIDAVVKALDNRTDSFYVQVNNDDPLTWHIAGPRSTSFVTRTVPGRFSLDAGPNRVRFYHRETGTELDRFALRLVEVPVSDCGPTAQLGESGAVSGRMVLLSPGIESAPGTPNKYMFDGEDYVEYCVTALEAGSYRLLASVIAPDQTSDSFYITVGDADPVTWHIPNGGEVSNQFPPVSFALDEGRNIVRFYHRELGTELLSFVFLPES